MLYAILADGFEEIEAIVFIDILKRAGVDIKTVSVNDSKIVTGAHGIPLVADLIIAETKSDDVDGIFLPGGMPGTTNLMNSKALCNMIIDLNNKKKYLIAICAAPMIFGELKLLQNKKATCYPSFEKHLIGADVCEDEVCIADNIFTSRGAGTAHELAFAFVDCVKGKEFSEQLRKNMQYK